MAEIGIIIEGKNVKSVFEINVQTANELFMGGAYAGEVITAVSPCLTFNDNGRQIEQFTLKFQADLEDAGDMGEASDLASEYGMSMVSKKPVADSFKGLGNVPHYRTFSFIKGEGLYVSTGSGLIFEHHRSDPDLRDLTLITKNQDVGRSIFTSASQLAPQSRGRDLFAVIQNNWDKKRPLT